MRARLLTRGTAPVRSAPAGRYVYNCNASHLPNSVRSGAFRAPLLTKLKTKSSPKTINITLLTELKTTQFGQ
jgi:hypothetical protein